MKEYSRKRLNKARSVLRSARTLAGEGDFDSAADRAYYAIFYTAEALLADRDLKFSSHGAVHGAFGKEFAKTRLLDPKYHGWLLRAFEIRQLATYGVDAELMRDDLHRLLERAEEFLATAHMYLAAAKPATDDT